MYSAKHLALTILIFASFACSISAAETPSEKKDPDAPIQRDTKLSANGLELFSWQAKGDDAWHFALLPAPGLDKLKSPAEVTAKEHTIEGVAALKQKLAALAIGEKVGWYNMLEKKDAPAGGAVFDYPPREIMKELELYCTVLKVRLNIYTTKRK
jgi:hypothetical protein